MSETRWGGGGGGGSEGEGGRNSSQADRSAMKQAGRSGSQYARPVSTGSCAAGQGRVARALEGVWRAPQRPIDRRRLSIRPPPPPSPPFYSPPPPGPLFGTFRYASGAASGLAYLHRVGIVHGNLRPSNMLVLRPAGPRRVVEGDCLER